MTTALSVYPRTPGFPDSPDFSCEVNGKPVFVHHQPGFAGGAISWVSFDFEGSVEVRVTSNWTVSSAEIRPLSADVQVNVQERTAFFHLDQTGSYFLKWNGEFDLPFYIFANSMEENIPISEDPKVIYFGPGLHEVGVVRPEEGQTVYLAPGSHVKGVIRSENASNVVVRGRGVISTSHLPFAKAFAGAEDVVAFSGGENILLEGITILDSFCWTVTAYGVRNWTVRGIRILNERAWSTDGINPVNCEDVLIEGCFARTKDDCVSVKALAADGTRIGPHAGKPVRNITVRNCVFWSDNNNGLVVGSETETALMENILFENIDLLKVSNTCGDLAAALSVISLHDNVVQNIEFKDIRIEHCTGPYSNVCFLNEIFRIPGRRSPKGGTLRNISFKNVQVIGGPLRHNIVRGLGPLQTVENVSYEGFRVHGKPVITLNDGQFFVNEFVRALTLSC